MQPCVRACCDMFDMCAWWQLKSPGFHVWRAVSSMEPKRATCLRELASMAFIWVRILPRLLSVTLCRSLTPSCFLFAPHLPKPTLSLLNSLILSSCLSLFLPLFVLLGHHSVSFALSFSCSLAPSFSLPSPSKPLARPGHTIVFARRTTKGQPCD